MKSFSKYNSSFPTNPARKKAVLVTLADKRFIKAARQFFSSAYSNAGWKGDYLLLAHNISPDELKWFENKGIIIRECKNVYSRKIADTPTAILDKFYLFTPYFKKWEIVIYYDADVIVRSSLEGLMKVKKFAAVNNCNNDRLKMEIINQEKLFLRKIDKRVYQEILAKLNRGYDLKKIAFGAGMFVFNTEIINNNIFKNLKNLVRKFAIICRNADQLVLNLYFYDQWQSLPLVYDFYILQNKNQWGVPASDVQAIALHFPGQIKPWDQESYFYDEWLRNYNKSKDMNILKPRTVQPWHKAKIYSKSFFLGCRFKYNFFAQNLKRKVLRLFFLLKDYLMVIYYYLLCLVERRFPRFFGFLKITKKKIKTFL